MKWMLVFLMLSLSSPLYAEAILEESMDVSVVEAESVKLNEAKLTESQIPVLSSAPVKKSVKPASTSRVFMSLAVIILLSGGLLFFSRWYAKNHKANSNTNKIRVLTQHFLGPRKSLAIVRVAGETILIGVTDHNISMLKSLSLLDDDVPESVSNHFQTSLDKADKDLSRKSDLQESESEDFVISNIKDKISTRLKNMRPL